MTFKRILPLFFALLLASCGKQTLVPSSFSEEVSQSVILALAPGETDSSDGLAAVIHNLSDREFAYGRAFLLEIRKEDGWYQLPYTDGRFTEEALVIPANRQVEYRFPLDRHFAPLKPGKYRILLNGVLYREDRTAEKQHLLLEFTVTEAGQLLP